MTRKRRHRPDSVVQFPYLTVARVTAGSEGERLASPPHGPDLSNRASAAPRHIPSLRGGTGAGAIFTGATQ